MAPRRAGAEEKEGAVGEVRRGTGCSGGQAQARSQPGGRGDQEAPQGRG